MPSLTPLAMTSELAAVNRLLSAISEAPISDLTNSTREDVALAVTLLKEASVEVQSLGWLFNREFGYEITPTTTLDWIGTDASTETLNIFQPPADLLSFRLTSTAKQSEEDIIIRRSRSYQEFTQSVLVFYDRNKNRDGLPVADFPYLYIDPVWLMEWDFLPETARRYITVRAARQFIQQTLGAADIAGYGEGDEARALYALQLDQGEEEDVSMLDNTEVARVRGYRPTTGFGFTDYRASPGPA